MKRLISQKITLIASSLLIGGLFLPISSLRAEDLPSALKEVTEKVSAISDAAENQTLPEDEKEREEVRIRKEALSKIFDLTLLEDKDLKNKLSNVEKLTPEQEIIREKLLAMIDENANAYAEMRSRLANLTAVEEIKQLALDFKDWRTAVYNPKFEKIVSFSLVFQERAILATASGRFKKIMLDIERLEAAKLLKKEDLKDIIEKITGTLQLAEQLNSQADKLITKTLAEELKTSGTALIISTKATSLTTPAASTTETAASKTKNLKPPSVKALVEESLGQVRTSYKLFLEMAKLIKSKIGI